MNVSAGLENAPAASTLRYVRGIGPKRALALERLGVHSLRDLFYFFPRRYEDRSRFQPIAEAKPGEIVTLRGEVLKVNFKHIPRRITLLEIQVGDESGMITAVWFNQPYLKNTFTEGQQVILFGKVDLYKDRVQIASPEYEIVEPDVEAVHTGRITPIYPLTEGLFQRTLRAALREAVQTELEKNVAEFLPEGFRAEKGLLELRQAVQEMHFPTSFENLEKARRRIVFDEFFLFQLLLLKRLEKTKTQTKSLALRDGDRWAREFAKSLPFTLTEGQAKTLKALTRDLALEEPMNRLLQGDVGSGKTVLAAFALLLAAKNGHQGAFLVPTEILAEQHARTLAPMLEPFGITVGLVTSSTPAPKKERLTAELRQGKLQILIGTHAILSENVRFKSLALVVTDEQHKFGVYQRSQLLQATPRPHQLVMTATPIPRTLALTIYGDLEISVLKELPAGRQPIKTYWITRAKQEQVLAHIRQKIEAGDQAYFIFPLIEETEKSDLLAATREYDKLRKGAFTGLAVGLVHGKVANEERDRLMRAFGRGEVKVIVATSVIEVGVNHPNATMMVIENAERFGLSQLHQMRGRIGRGEKPSECFLFGEPKTLEGQKRLRILTKTQDGFLIAEEDLKLRGPGDFWGTKQSGESFFRYANPLADQPLLESARQTALELIKHKTLEGSDEWALTKKYLEQLTLRY